MKHPLALTDIHRIVQERLQETASLDFKREVPEPGKNDGIAKAIAAMSNTAGGTIIFGIEDDSDSRANKLMPFPLKGTTERIALVSDNLDEPVTPTAIYTVEESPGIGYLAVELAQSDRAPHFYAGTAYGRTPTTTVSLTRRQVGELFARSTGFLQEFRLSATPLGRLLVQGCREGTNTWVEFSNPGDDEIHNVEWLDLDSSQLIIQVTVGWPFPILVLRPGQIIRQTVAVALGMGPFTVKSRWLDGEGELHDDQWRITF